MDENSTSLTENSVLARALRRVQCQSDFTAQLNSLRNESEAALEILEKAQEGRKLNYILIIIIKVLLEFRNILAASIVCKDHFGDLNFQVLEKKQHKRLKGEIDQRINKLIEIVEGHDGLIILETNRLKTIVEYLQIAQTKREISYQNYLRVCQPQKEAQATFDAFDISIVSLKSTESNAEPENN